MKTIGYVLADFPTFSETFARDDTRAAARLGDEVEPLVLHRCDGLAKSADTLLACAARAVSRVSAAAPPTERAAMGQWSRRRTIALFSLDAPSQALSRVFEAA